MTVLERKKHNQVQLHEKWEMLNALVDAWIKKCGQEYTAEDWAYLQELKRKRRKIEVRIKNLSV